MASKLKAALEWASRGFRVFPLIPHTKSPAIAAHQFAATTDVETIRSWWLDPAGHEREYNIGVSTTGMVVVDLDTKSGKDGVASYDRIGGEFDTLRVRTPTGGYHLYFNGPDSALAVNIAPGVDIRSHHGYVIAPGSYVNDKGVIGEYTLDNDVPIAEVPVGVEILLRTPDERRARLDSAVDVDGPSAIATATEWLNHNAPLAVEGQGGDSVTYQVAAKLVRDFALTETTAYFLLLENWNERCSPPWTADDLYKKVENAAEYGTGDLGKALPEKTFASTVVLPVPPPTPPKELGIYFGNAMLPSTIPARAWIAERFLLRGETTLIAANGAGGKSAITLAAMAHYAVGRDFGPYRLKVSGKPLRVVVYNAEDDMAEQSRRLLAICSLFGLDYQVVQENICFITKDHIDLVLARTVGYQFHKNDDAINMLVELITLNTADVCVIDPLVNVHDCNENDNPIMKQVMKVFEEIAMRANCAMIVLHHTSKDSGSDNRAGNIGISRGAGAIVNTPRISLTLTGATSEDRTRMRIADTEKHSYVRIDDGKANYFLRSSDASVWLKWMTAALPSGDFVGVPVPQDMDARKDANKSFLATKLRDFLVASGGAALTRAHCIKMLQVEEPLYAELKVSAIEGQINSWIGQGFSLADGDVVYVSQEKIDGRLQWLVMLR